jgi:hypothetical protein
MESSEGAPIASVESMRLRMRVRRNHCSCYRQKRLVAAQCFSRRRARETEMREALVRGLCVFIDVRCEQKRFHFSYFDEK